MVASRNNQVLFALAFSVILVISAGHCGEPVAGENRLARLQQARTWMYPFKIKSIVLKARTTILGTILGIEF